MQRAWWKWLIYFGLWTFMGFAFAGQLYLSRANIGIPVTWGFAISRALADWYVFALLSIPVMKLARLFRLDHPHGARNLVLHLALSAVFSVGWMALRAWIEDLQSRATPWPVSFGRAFSHALVATFSFNLLIYWVVVNVTYAIDYYLKFKEREVRAAELEKRLAEARLQALQMQLNPHFLFNTLNSIASLMHKNVDLADRMITRLGDLLRHTLESPNAQEVTLQEELSFLDRYLEIEQIRFGDRLVVRRQISEDAVGALVPNLVLQPLVENAIRHGLAPRARAGVIDLRAWRTADSLHLQVEDNGGGFAAGPVQLVDGVGLANTRERLGQLYGSRFALRFDSGREHGLRVTVQVPFRTSRDRPDVTRKPETIRQAPEAALHAPGEVTARP